jgi:predicted tellurium resistance membrane protein TerC
MKKETTDMLDFLADSQAWASLTTLTVLEVVLSIDNLVVIAVLVGKLPKERQANARYVGMTLALVPRLVLLVFIGWIIGLTEPCSSSSATASRART